jgi:FlaA1/EpsC-like NDP-sugar epimerase
MGATKRLAEMIVLSLNKLSDTEFVAVRFGNVMGSNGSVVPLFKKQIAQGGPVTITHPEIIRYFMTIPEAAQLVIQAGAMAEGGEVFILDMGQPVKIVDLARDLIQLSGFKPDMDIKLEFTGLRPGEKLYEELLLKEEGIQKTRHEKILVVKPPELSYNEILLLIKTLESCLNDYAGLRKCMARIVPTYSSSYEESAVKKKRIRKKI